MNKTRLLKTFLVLSFLIVSLFPTVALADSDRVTKGDVEAMFNAFTTGGRIIFFQDNGSAGLYASPISQVFTGAIRPLPQWDGGHFCVDDWHLIVLGAFEGGDLSYKVQDAESSLSVLDLTFILDGVEILTDRTPIKRFLVTEHLGFDKAYGFQEGKILAPDEVAVGEHNLTVNIDDPVFGPFELAINFFIDDSDSEACN